jgi:uncharacterized protein YvpB
MYEVEVITRPEFDYVLAKNPNQVVVTPNELLSQDTIYEVELKLIPKTFVFKTQEKKDGKYQTTKFRTKFATVKTPNIKKFSPKGTTVLVNKPIILEFNTAMDLDTVKDNFVIKPQTEGSFETPDNHTLRFIPKNPLPKETNFEVKVNKGFQNIAGGISDQELSFKFRTIGEIRVLDTFPENNDNYVNVNTNQIRIQFDQKVDKESAQSKFSISPSLDGSFEWKDNTMIYNLSQDLAYQTRYTVSLRKGVKSINGIDLKNNYSFQFVSRSNITLIDVPWHAQTENFTCNVQATAMVLDYYGNYFGEQEMKQKIGVQPALNKNTWTGGNPYEGWVENYGVYWTRVSEVISEYRTNEVKRNWNVQGLTTAVENGNPSILWWYNDYSKPKEWFSWETPDGTVVQGLNGMHSEVVVGFEGPADNPTHIYTNDPWRGKNRRYTIATFKDLWSNFNNTAVVVY